MIAYFVYRWIASKLLMPGLNACSIIAPGKNLVVPLPEPLAIFLWAVIQSFPDLLYFLPESINR